MDSLFRKWCVSAWNDRKKANGVFSVDAIIFLAPLVFTQVLQEDPTVNRVEDSIQIWKKICANQLLARATLILFLNKMDIVARTLKNGVQLKDYVPSYGDHPNQLEYVVKCGYLPEGT